MSELDDSFSKLLGRQPSDAERQQLYKVRDALGLKNNDALWLVLMALQYYQGQYEKFPQVIAQAAKDTLVNFKVTADATVKAAKADLAKAVASAAHEVAHNTSAKQMWQWAAGCIAVAFLCVGVFGWCMHSSGHDGGYNSGYGVGYSEARDEKAAAAWANTPEGKLAYRFAQTGSLASLAKCDRPGWYIEKGACYVKPASDGTYGWKLPERAESFGIHAEDG